MSRLQVSPAIEMPPLPQPPAWVHYQRGPSLLTLCRRVAYGGRKGRSAARRLRQPRYAHRVVWDGGRVSFAPPNMCCELKAPNRSLFLMVVADDPGTLMPSR